MTSEQKYNRAFRYAHSIDPNNDRDLLHDAFLNWFNKTGKNLFEEEPGIINKTIKYTHYNNIRKNSYMVNGVRHQKYHSDYIEGFTGSNSTTPEDIYISKELDNLFLSSTAQLDIYLYAVQGYRPFEIAGILNKPKKTIEQYFKKMAYVAALFN